MGSRKILTCCRQAMLVVLAVGLGMFLSVPAGSQQPKQAPGVPSPRLFIVTPCGGQAGTNFTVVVSGLDLDNAQSLLFSHAGFKAEAESSTLPPPDDGDKKKRQPGTPGANSAFKFKVTVGADVPPGIHDVRVVNRWGVSNPRAFVVGNLNEVQEKEPNNDVPEAQRVEINTTVNGTIAAPTDVDYFVFAGKKGQRVVVSCLTSSIDSRLPAAVQIYDSERRLLATNRGYTGTDALTDCTIAADGDFYIRVFGFTYTQGSAEHFYRLSITTAPWIDAVYPPVVEPGKATTVTVYGRNLPGGKLDPAVVIDGRPMEKATVTVNSPKEPIAHQRLAFRGFVPPNATSLDGFEYRISNGSGTSNGYLLTLAQAPVVIETDANNDTPESAQKVTIPCEIAGRIEKRRDRDWYSFEAKKGEVYSVEAYGDRLGSPIDLYFALRGPDNKTVGEFDDNPDVLKPNQFFTRTEDPIRYRFLVPADGAYQLQISSREADIQSGPRDQYRIRITPEQPDFRLIVMPSSTTGPEGVTLNQGGRQYYTVLAWRLDGFNGDITLSADGLPQGVSCPPQTVGAGLRQGTIVVNASDDAPAWTGEIQVKGTATIAGKPVVREARAASITWPVPQGITPVARLDRSLALAVREQAAFTLTAGSEKIMTVPGEKVTVPVKVARLWPDSKVAIQLTAVNLPTNLTIGTNNQPITLPADKDEVNIVLDVKNVAPGTYTIVLLGQAQLTYSRDPMGKKAPATVAQPSSPLIVTVLPKQVAEVSVTPATPTATTGKPLELTVKVNRLYDFAGEFKVSLVLPNGTKGIKAEEVTIPAGKDEAKLIIDVARDAPVGKLSGLLVQATAKINDKLNATQETKFSLTVVK